MHPFALIPFVAVLVAAAFGAVSLAWDSDRRATGWMSAIFACAGVWALLDLLSQLETDPQDAVFWLRLVHAPVLLIGPCVIALLAQMLPQCAEPLRPWMRPGLVASLALSLAFPFLPGVVLEAAPMPWGGWMPRYGLATPALLPLAAILPIVGMHHAARAVARSHGRGDRARSRAVAAAVCGSLLVAVPTELVLPVLAIPAPRLGALAVVLAAGIMWLRVLHHVGDLVRSPHGMARAVLAELGDGIALVGLDGRILSANARLAELAGRRSSALVGEQLDWLVDIPLEALRRGVEDRESVFGVGGREALPVAVSSSLARDRRGGPIGFVVVLRDLRDVDLLRRRLLTSGRLAAIGELAAGIAHEVNNPVAFIRADLHFLASRFEEMRELLEKEEADLSTGIVALDTGPGRIQAALEATEQIAQVVSDVRGFAHAGGAGQGGVDLAALLEGPLRLARLERGDEVEVRVRAGAVTHRVPAGQELKQVLLALLRLLVSGSAGGGRVEVDVEGADRELRIRLAADRLVDTAMALRQRFLELGGGTEAPHREDLGLAVAAELVAEMGGALKVAELAEHGLCIELHVPLSEEEPT